MLQKRNTIIACLHSKHSRYILELNKFIRKNDPNISILATENKKIYAKGRWTGLYRPMICFDYSEKEDKQLCFFMTGDKDYHKRDDPRFYFFDSNDKLRIDNPIWIPTKYLNQINFNLMTGQNKTQETMDKITKIYNQFNEAIKNKDEIWSRYSTIKAGNSNRHSILYAYEQMTARDTLCERFYHMELEKIKEQESLLAKFQHSQGGGSSGTPIEENKKTLEQDSGRPR